jgi:hypothetical protein
MRKLVLTIATAATAAAISFAPSARADETTITTTTQPQTTQQAQPAPQQNVTVQPAQPAPTSQTTTTAAPYAPPPQGQEMYAERSTEHRPNKTLLSTGVGVFVISYGASVVAGAVSPRDEDKNLFIPVVGPWLDLNDRNGAGGSVDRAMIITSGVAQGVGVLLGISSLIIPETTSTTEKRDLAKPTVHVTPVSYQAGAGLGAIGTF